MFEVYSHPNESSIHFTMWNVCGQHIPGDIITDEEIFQRPRTYNEHMTIEWLPAADCSASSLFLFWKSPKASATKRPDQNFEITQITTKFWPYLIIFFIISIHPLLITYLDYNFVVFYGLSKLNNNNILIKIVRK